MKNLDSFDFNVQYPLHIDRETIPTRDAYKEFLIRKGYAIDPSAISTVITEKPVTEESITELFDALEAKAKADFAPVRRRGPNRATGESNKPKIGEA